MTAYPPAPWTMYGAAWGSLFLVRGAHDRPDGLYAAGWVRYDEPSPLTYHELLVGRVRRDLPGKPLTITDIWVDSPASREGGRDLWSIPKELADYEVDASHTGPWHRRDLLARTAEGPIATARFHHLAAPLPAVPFTGATSQPLLDASATAGGSPVGRATRSREVTTRLGGRGAPLPARSTWWFAPDGPLGWLHGQRRLGSVHLDRFRMTFG